MKGFNVDGVGWNSDPRPELDRIVSAFEADTDHSDEDVVTRGVSYGEMYAIVLISRRLLGNLIEPSNVFMED